jgi:anti-sigma B factor antagonist
VASVVEQVLAATVRAVGNVAVVDLQGKGLIDSGEEPYSTAAALAAKGRLNVLLNFASVSYYDSAGLGVLVRSYTVLQRMGGILKLLRPQKQLRDLLHATKLASVFEIFEDEDAAIKSFAP